MFQKTCKTLGLLKGNLSFRNSHCVCVGGGRANHTYLYHGSVRAPTFYVWSCEVNSASVYLRTIHLKLSRDM